MKGDRAWLEWGGGALLGGVLTLALMQAWRAGTAPDSGAPLGAEPGTPIVYPWSEGAPPSSSPPHNTAPGASPAEPPPPVAEAEPPAPANFVVQSDVAFTSLTDVPHQLRVVYQGPALVRWELEALVSERPPRQIEYRSGADCYRQDPGSTASTPIAPAEDPLARMELRRLALSHALTTGPVAPAEARLVELTEAGLPGRSVRITREGAGDVRYALLDIQGRETESLTIERWAARHGRSWPAELVLHTGGEELWRETVTDVRVDVGYADSYFLPPDRR